MRSSVAAGQVALIPSPSRSGEGAGTHSPQEVPSDSTRLPEAGPGNVAGPVAGLVCLGVLFTAAWPGAALAEPLTSERGYLCYRGLLIVHLQIL